jgi:hypothetical protein
MLPFDLLAQPPVAALIFFVLHTLDFLLTIAGERVRQRRAARVLCIPGSYELNPLFRKVVDERRWWSWRFVLTLLGGTAAFYAFSAMNPYSEDPWAAVLLEVLLGSLIFSRLFIITRHLHNLWFFDRIARYPQSLVGQVTYDRRTVLGASVSQSAASTLLLLLAFLASPSFFILGGLVTLALLTVMGLVLMLKAKPAEAAPQSVDFAGPV